MKNSSRTFENGTQVGNGFSLTRLLGTIAIGGTIAANLMACSPSSISNTSGASSMELDQVTHTFNRDLKPGTPAAIVVSDQMGRLAEQLVRGNTIIQAHKIAFQALELNQFNVHAQFIEKLTAPQLELKGIYTRIKPIVSVRKDKYKEYSAYLKGLKDVVAYKDSMDFLLDGQPDLHTESQAQAVIEKYVEKVDELRDWLKENRKNDIVVNYYEPVGSEVPACRAVEKARGVWEVTNCTNNVLKFTGKMNMADFEALRQVVAGVQVYLAMTTAYTADGAFKAAANLRDENMTPSEKYKALSPVKGIGQLRNTKLFVLLPKVMSDFVVGYRVAKKLDAELCPHGSHQDESRQGMLFHKGICANQLQDGDRIVATLDALARGQVTVAKMQITNAEVEATLDSKTFLRKPPQDLRDLGPFKFDKCGELVSQGDGTGAGLFANGELNSILAWESQQNCAAEKQ